MDAGYRVFEACEAADALTILEGRDDIGTVFTDIEMSGMTGLALAGVITEGWPEIAILVTSGRIQPDPGTLPDGAAFIAKHYKADRKSVVKGKSVSGRVDIGGRRILKKKIMQNK